MSLFGAGLDICNIISQHHPGETYPGGAEVGAEVATPGPSSSSAASGTAANDVYVARKAIDRFDPHVDELGEYSPSTPCEPVDIYGSLDSEI